MSEVIFYGDAANIAKNIDESEWEFFKYANVVADQIYHLMEVHGVNKTELAKRLGTSKAHITNILRGDANLTFKTFSKVVFVLGGEINTSISSKSVDIQPVKEDKEAEVTRWFGVLKSHNIIPHPNWTKNLEIDNHQEILNESIG